ncbi:diguanylate cyclase [Sulfuritortus calidifontis]|uniref:diguanylate cyclase n=1 Tax=Sulfuritortus calidifontis TaxID=1914471 RepID=A0A4V2UQM6_9PROT|nr:GGDEF domain-containing protein [Sulfuritortus calidifontis]TCS71521.1 diguanylate cyclase [Sulfuritortus calidifontis]
MEHPSQPTDIAREALKWLSQRKLPPTPDNYRRAYAEVSGEEVKAAPWPEAIRSLLSQWDIRHVGLSQKKKKEMVERVLINFGNQPNELHEKITALVRSWSESPESRKVLEGEEGEVPAEAAEAEEERAATTEVAAPAGRPLAELGRAFADNVELFIGGCEVLWPDLAQRARSLVAEVEAAQWQLAERHIADLGHLWREFIVRAEDNVELLEGLKRVVALLFRNVGDMFADDPWVQNQVTAIHAMVGGQLNYYSLFDAERTLEEVVNRQKALQDNLREAKSRLKGLISTFVDRVGELTDATGEQQDRIQGYADRIAAADDLAELNEVMEGLTAEMGRMRDQMRQTHGELLDARRQVEQADERIHELERELQEVANLVREDQLTGALNRRGMEEAMARELARAERMAAPLSLALLDIDHFKKINDSYGHQAGDQALVHLSKVTRQLLRPSDSLGRWGGEEFLIMLPNTDLAEAEKVMQRLQRELTKTFFLHDNQRILITFSAGVAQRQAGEERDLWIRRADQAMYQAKAKGRNRVERG